MDWLQRLTEEGHSLNLSLIYKIICLVLFIFLLIRPIGIGVDDFGYTGRLFNITCPSIYCGIWIQGQRDFLWYSSIGALRSVIDSNRVIFILPAISFILKCVIIRCYCKNYFLSLVLYLPLYYIYFDLTLLRVSCAQAFLLISLILISYNRIILAFLGILIASMFHIQALAALPIFLFVNFDLGRLVSTIFMILPIILVLLGVCPNRDSIEHLYQLPALRSLIDMVYGGYQSLLFEGAFEGQRAIALSTCLSVAISSIAQIMPLEKGLQRVSSGMIIMSSIALLIYSPIPDAQNRIWAFLFSPIIFLVGTSENRMVAVVISLSLAAIFFIKHLVIHRLFHG